MAQVRLNTRRKYAKESRIVLRNVIKTYWHIFLLLSFASCTQSSGGDVAGQSPFTHSPIDGNPHFDLTDIQNNGELIVLTTYGPGTFFEFRGENFGVQYMIANEYAKSIGASIRVDVSRNERELIQKLRNGEGDIVAYHLTPADSLAADITYCGEKLLGTFLDSIGRQRGDKSIAVGGTARAWAVRDDSPLLAASLNEWMNSHSADFFDYATIKVRSSSGKVYAPRRSVKSPILNAARGQISVYDDLFKRHSTTCSWDWRLLAAQAYQESAFDPQAVSFMGAMGLMQLMPSTARSVGVAQSEVFVPESNVRGAVKLITQLNAHYSDIASRDERVNFILAAYNAGPGHVDDARALARKHGKDANVWLGNVDSYVLNMSKSTYYNQPEVKHGYFRGSETYNYVNSIRTRWDEYKRKIK